MSTLARAGYRLRQFQLALQARPAPTGLAEARSLLGEEQFTLFAQMQLSEQAHSLHVLRCLKALGETHPDLLRAALLHDVGKIRYPLALWERALIVLGKALLPGLVQRLGDWPDLEARPPIWRKAFVVSNLHPTWGAQMVQAAGASTLCVALIRRHQDALDQSSHNPEDDLLRKLQAVDDES